MPAIFHTARCSPIGYYYEPAATCVAGRPSQPATLARATEQATASQTDRDVHVGRQAGPKFLGRGEFARPV